MGHLRGAHSEVAEHPVVPHCVGKRGGAGWPKGRWVLQTASYTPPLPGGDTEPAPTNVWICYHTQCPFFCASAPNTRATTAVLR